MDLPLNCTASYHKSFLSTQLADSLFEELSSINALVQRRTVISMAGKKMRLPNGKLMFIDQQLQAAFPKAIWGPSMLWTKTLNLVKESVIDFSGVKFAVCVGIYYPDGQADCAYHTDYPAFGDTAVIASLSLGAERPFMLREKESHEEYEILLEHGSLLIMGEHCQDRYEHGLPAYPQCKTPRINLTFRKYGY